MKPTILIDINHPAHVHFFKNVYFELIEKGYKVIVTASLKEINYELLRKYNIDFIDLGSYGKTPLMKMFNIPLMALKMAGVVRKYKPDILMGIASSRICHATMFSKRTTYVFTDTEHATEQIALFKPFATKIFTPDSFTKDLGKKHIRYKSYHELAYLHPNRFKPNPDVLKELSLKANEPFFVLRFVSWGASHDIGQKGLSVDNKRKLIELLKPIGKIIISSEGQLPSEFEPYRLTICPAKMHDLLYYTTLFIGEGATMASECAMLGTPAIYINSLDAGTLKEQEKLGLIYNLRNDSNLIHFVQTLLKENLFDKEKQRLLSKNALINKLDVTQFILDLISNWKNPKVL